YDLLTHEPRREAARLSTRLPMAARFLEELPPILRRNPEFLWPAAARISKLVLDDALARLIAPRGGGGPIGALLRDGRSPIVRLPISRIGPEAAGLAATLIAARIYYERTGAWATGRPPLLFALDEAQAFGPTLLSEIVSEGRKFGVTALLATQFPDRLPEPLRGAAAGSAGIH